MVVRNATAVNWKPVKHDSLTVLGLSAFRMQRLRCGSVDHGLLGSSLL